MGVRQLQAIASELMAGGRSARRACGGRSSAGTLPGQRVVTGTLETIAEVAAAAGIKAPAISVFGPVAALREQLAWLEARPLYGRDASR